MKNLFIDSNIWLSLYHFTNDDLAQFEKLKKQIGENINLYITQQIVDEVKRNREAKLIDALKSFEVKSFQYPVFCKGYDEYEPFSSDYKDIICRFNAWRKQIEEDIKNQCLPADKTINRFFDSANIISTNSFENSAYMRYLRGNPPGKDNKYGDAINWEILLGTVPDGEDLYFISADRDYCSPLDTNRINPYLNYEWERKKQSKIHFYKNLVLFLNEHFEDIKLQCEQIKQEQISRLWGCRCFADTHKIIAELSENSQWDEQQIEELCSAALENNQIKWILDDEDIFEFYSKLLKNKNIKKDQNSATFMMYIELEAILHQKAEEEKKEWEADIEDMKEDGHYGFSGGI